MSPGMFQNSKILLCLAKNFKQLQKLLLLVIQVHLVGSTEAPDGLKSDHLKSRIERGFVDIFSHHICSAVTGTIRVTNYATSFSAKTKFEAAKMILDPWNQRIALVIPVCVG